MRSSAYWSKLLSTVAVTSSFDAASPWGEARRSPSRIGTRAWSTSSAASVTSEILAASAASNRSPVR